MIQIVGVICYMPIVNGTAVDFL